MSDPEAGWNVITNKRYLNSTYLVQGAADETVKASADDKSTKYRWELINVNGDWVLKNKFTSLFAYVGSSPTVDTQVVGVIDGSHSTRWSIKSTGQPEHFTISPINVNLYWGLDSNSPGTPVTLREVPTDATNQWVFTPKPTS